MSLDTAAIKALPKVVLHDHLDGGLRPQTILELAQEVGHTLPADTAESLAQWFATTADSGSLVKYLETFDHTIAVMQTESGLARVAREAVLDLARDGVIYAELRYAPEQHQQRGLTLQQVVEAVQRGIDEGEAEAEAEGLSIRAEALLSAMRHADRALEIAELTVENLGTHCVGFDIAGAEDGFPPSRMADAFTYLRENLASVTTHAGEAAGADSVREALTVASALRLGHGIRVHEDIEGFGTPEPVLGRIAQTVLDRQIVLEVAPRSNVQTGAAESLDNHPIHALRDLGFAITINTDNRLMSNTSMSGEMTELAERGWELPDFFHATVNAALAAFIPFDDRQELCDLIAVKYAELFDEIPLVG